MEIGWKITDKPKPMPKVWGSICNDATHTHRNLGIEASEELFIPMPIQGSTCGLSMYLSTHNKLHECQKVLLSYEFDCYPSNNLFEISLMEEEYRTSSNFHRYINIVESIVPCAPPTIKCIDDLWIHEFDRAIENAPIELTHDLMVDRLISKVWVKITRSGFSTYRYK